MGSMNKCATVRAGSRNSNGPDRTSMWSPLGPPNFEDQPPNIRITAVPGCTAERDLGACFLLRSCQLLRRSTSSPHLWNRKVHYLVLKSPNPTCILLSYFFKIHFNVVRSEVLTAERMTNITVWDVTPCRPVEVHRRRAHREVFGVDE
jgi:hypothetical protein